MNNAYLKDIIKHDSVYQGVITSDTPINFYSLCKKVFEKASDGPRGNARTEIYKIIDFDYADFIRFFELDGSNAEELYNMLLGRNWRKLEIFAVNSAAYRYIEEVDAGTENRFYTTANIPFNFQLVATNEDNTFATNIEMYPIIDGQTISEWSKISCDLVLKAYGYGEY